MLLQYVFYLPTIFSIVLVALFTYLNNRRNLLNISFAILCLNIIVWLTLSFLADTSTTASNGLLFINSAVAFASFFPTTYLFFVRNFPDNKESLIGDRILYSYGLISLATFILSLAGYVISEVRIGDFGVEIVGSSLVYSAMLLFWISGVVLGVVELIHKRKNRDSLSKSQISTVLLGISAVAVVNAVTNGLLVVLGTSELGPIIGTPSLLILAASISFAIIRQNLFDIRAVVTRAVAFVLSFAIILGIYVVFLLTIADVFFEVGAISVSIQLFYIMLAVAIGISFPFVKSFTTKITTRVLYPDDYVLQDVINAVSDNIVRNIDLKQVIDGSLLQITNSINPQLLSLLLYQGSATKTRQLLVENKPSSMPKIDKKLLILLEKQQDNIVSFHDITASHPMYESMKMNQIELSVRLLTNNKTIGFLLLGSKRSGNMYSSKDLQLISIFSNELAIAIQNSNSYEEIKNFNKKLQNEIERATLDLKRSNKKLKDLDEAKDEFISMASHQLRTPLTSIKGYISMVMEGDAGKISGKQEELLGEAFTSSQRMVYLIADLLNVSRLKTGKFLIEKAPINLAEVVEGEIKQLTETAKSRNLNLVYEKPENFPEIELDETKTRQVIMNFADNAIYYTPAGGNIEIQVKANKDSIEYRVVDDGIGVKKADQKHLFTKFFRASNAKRARPDGTGLGLYMAQRVITAQDGVVIFESKEGKGSTFGFRFPRKKSKK